MHGEADARESGRLEWTLNDDDDDDDEENHSVGVVQPEVLRGRPHPPTSKRKMRNPVQLQPQFMTVPDLINCRGTG